MTTYITFVLDETGSMGSMKEEAISGFNKYIETVSDEVKGRTSFSLLLFDSNRMHWLADGVSVKKVIPLNEDTYRPGALTPLWDAVNEAITHTEKRIKRAKDPAVILTILTDGEENASQEVTAEDVRARIKGLENDWAFNFLGVGVDAWHGERMGIGKMSTRSFQGNAKGLVGATQMSAQATVRYANASRVQQSALNSAFLVDLDDDDEDTEGSSV